MNNLSWFLYLAGVVSSLGEIIALIIFIGMMVIGFSSFIRFAGERDNHPAYPVGGWKQPLKYIPIFTVAIIATTFIPSAKTLYMIAGSELGEQVVTSQEGKKIIKLIQEGIKKELAQ